MGKKTTNEEINPDDKVQAGLVRRVAVYWLAGQLVTLAVVSGVSYLENGTFSHAFRFVIPAFIAGIVTLPLVLADVLTYSNRFAGPMVNFRRKFSKMAQGELELLKFRPEDFYQDIQDNYNLVLERLKSNQESAENPDHEQISV